MIACVLLVGALQGCLTDTTKGSAMNKIIINERASCRLEVQLLQITTDLLKIRYTFGNHSAQNVYLFNRLYNKIDGKKFLTNVNNVYIDFEQNKSVISKKIFPVPMDLDVERSIVPCASLVKPGATIAETLEIQLPLVPVNPYRNLKNLAELPQKVDLWFEVGYVTLPPDGERLAVNVDTLDGLSYYFGSFPADKQMLLRAGPLPNKVPANLPK